MRRRILVVFGTRPEAIKLAPVVHQIRQAPDLEAVVCVTGQHREMLDQALAFFQVGPDFDLEIMQPDQSLYEVTANAIQRLEEVVIRVRPDWVVVQGDTTTTLMGALAAYYARVPVAHVEAGLRTHDKYAPFPEEMNRRLTSHIADIHFAPTERARQNLLREGIASETVFVTGNPVIDALLWAVRRVQEDPSWVDPLVRDWLESEDRRVVLVTAHRREAFGEGLRAISQAVRDLAGRYLDCVFVWPVHLNPNVRRAVAEILGPVVRPRRRGDRSYWSGPNVLLLEPVDYPTLVWLLDRSYLVLTDSGGIQEEAPTLGKPVLVLRDVTERPEGVEAGTALLVGPHYDRIVQTVEHLIEDPEAYARIRRAVNPYGDGRAAERIVHILRDIGR
ncbi:MAG: UDP-N-acetylglucosamine 2-epimerase (non-hydrolyzing) [Acidobacteria bacterium]|nr:UDP-N-acetylglucosamine 2-epimerase (non-hydrolyzing) [Acidobacteriota bacterium]MDW7984625.1 UDP-N-acetylglucosamine 2-epimerase (non-hydrolyzing) [Acidobacteriota bacterium]